MEIENSDAIAEIIPLSFRNFPSLQEKNVLSIAAYHIWLCADHYSNSSFHLYDCACGNSTFCFPSILTSVRKLKKKYKHV